jgi:hypothetical protein
VRRFAVIGPDRAAYCAEQFPGGTVFRSGEREIALASARLVVWSGSLDDAVPDVLWVFPDFYQFSMAGWSRA